MVNVTSSRFSGIVNIVRNTGILAFANVLDRLVSFVLLIAIGRELGLLEYGRYTLATVVGAIVFQITSLGLNGIVRRDVARNPTLIGRYLGNSLQITLLANAVGIVAVAIFCLAAGYEQATVWVMLGIAIVFACETLLLLPFAVIEAQEHMGYELSVIALRLLLLLGLPLIFAWNYGLAGVVVAGVLVNLARVAVSVWMMYAYFAPIDWRVDFQFWRWIIVESWPLALALVFNAIYYRIDSVMLSVYRGETEVGIYNAAYSFLNLAGVVSMAFLRAVFPRYVQYACDPPRLARVFYRSLAVMVLAGMATTLVMYVFAGQIITLAFSSAFAQSIVAMMILAWAALFMFMSSTCGVLLNATGRQKDAMYVTAGMMVFNMLLNFFFIPRMGYIGASYVTLLSYLVSFVVMMAIIVRDFRRPGYLIGLNSH